MNGSIQSAIYVIACLLLLAGVFGLMVAHIPWFAWLVLVGGLGYSTAHIALMRRRRGVSAREKRLHRLSSVVGFLWLAVAITALNHVHIWSLFTLAAVVFMAYSDISLVLILAKEEKNLIKENKDNKQ